MLNWGQLGEDKFNRAVELLVTKTVEEDHPGLQVSAVDGRGGDGGIDLDVTVRKTGKLVSIYQLKYFPEGFSGNWAPSRHAQIKKSFTAALAHNPEKWALVIPRNFAPGERRFLESLRGRAYRPRIERIGQTRLDEMLMRLPDAEDFINRDATFAALKIVGRESALLSRPADLAKDRMPYGLGQRTVASSSRRLLARSRASFL